MKTTSQLLRRQIVITRLLIVAIAIGGAIVLMAAERQPSTVPTDESLLAAIKREQQKATALTEEQVKIIADLLTDQAAQIKTLTRQADQMTTGRFQIVMSTIAARDTYLLDTQSGRTWIIGVDPSTKVTGWAEIYRYDGKVAKPETNQP